MTGSLEQPRRVDQILTAYGYCSRREARTWVRHGRVLADDRPVAAADAKVVASRLRIDGEPVECPDGVLALLHKPAGYVCSHADCEGPVVYDLLPARWPRRHPPVTSVGRLDRDTTGVLLLTDSGSLVQRWTSPRHEMAKLYEVTVDRPLRPELAAIFAAGDLLLEGEDKPCRPAKLAIRGAHEATLELVEGRYHQVKRMFASQGFAVTRLHRSRFGEFDLTGLPVGAWKLLPPPAGRER